MRKDPCDRIWSKIALFQLASFGLLAGKIFLQDELVYLESVWLSMFLVIGSFLLLLGCQYVLLCCLQPLCMLPENGRSIRFIMGVVLLAYFFWGSSLKLNVNRQGRSTAKH